MKRDVTGQQFATQAIHAGEATDPVTGAHNTPIYQTSTYAFTSLAERHAYDRGEFDGYIYTRAGNPTARAFEEKLAQLEGAEAAVLSASGMGAISATLLSLLRQGDHMVCADTIYPTNMALIRDDFPGFGIETSFVDIADLDAVAAAIRPETKVLYTEALANPSLVVADLPALAAMAHERGLVFIVDATFASPYLLRPLEHGADLVLHSATKYISGHGDTLAGVVAGPKARIDPIRTLVSHLGSPISPFNAWLLLRGIKTLELRMERHCQNAMKLAEYLATRPEVEKLNYPGLPGDPSHEVAKRLMGDRFGGMVSFEIVGGGEAGQQFADALQLFAHGVSLGDVASLIWPWWEGSLVRVSVGIEGADDLIADFDQAFHRIG